MPRTIPPRPTVNDLARQRADARKATADPAAAITAESAEAEPTRERLYEDVPVPDPPSTNPANGEAAIFTRGPARRPARSFADPLLQWATGLTTRERTIYAGWLVESGKHEDLDAAMERAGFSQVTIKHGSGNMVTHWAIETANLFVVCEGVQSIGETRYTEERYGIAFGWARKEDGRMQSQLRCRVLLRPLLDAGYHEPLLLTVKSTLTGDLITALMRQYEVLDAIDAFRAADGKPALQPPFYACSLPLGPGQEVARGSGDQTKEITPMVAQIPAPVTKEYVRSQWIRREWAQMIEGMLDDTIRWSVTTSRLIGAGEETGQGYEE